MNNKKEEIKNKNTKNAKNTKSKSTDKNKVNTPTKSPSGSKKNTNASKKEKNPKDNKNISDKKSSGKKKNTENIKPKEPKENNTEDKEKDKDKDKDNLKPKEEKLPLYLCDSCCIEHGQVYESYCHDCLKNICSVCKKNEHENHNMENLDEIMINEEKLLNIKQSLEKDKKDLNYINDYFNKLIEKIKEQFTYFYSLKQKEIEIKQKIINNYETIKYNYNTIQNINNINYFNINNDKNSIISKLENLNNNNKYDILSELKLIFNYLNESTQITNLLNYYKNKNKYFISKGKEEISEMIKTDINDIAITLFNGCLYIYDTINFEQKICCKIFDNNKGIYHITQLRNGDFACAGYERIKIVNIDLDNKKYYINNEIKMENGSFNLVKELKNNYLVTYDTNNKLKIWYNYKIIYEYNNININCLLPLKDNLFMTSSINDKKINLYNIYIDKTNFNKISCFSLNNISVINNSILKLNDNYIIVLASNEEKKTEEISEKFEECKNNEENKNNENGICLIEISSKNKLNIIQNIKNKSENKTYINIINYINNSILALNDLGYIELWDFDKINKKMFILNQFKAIDIFLVHNIRNFLLIEDNKKIFLQAYNYLICLSNE